MSVTLRTLSAGAYTQGVTAWFYVTSDSRRDIEGRSYWLDATNVVKPGDWLFITHTGTPGNSIYCAMQDTGPNGPFIRARRLVSTFGENGN